MKSLAVLFLSIASLTASGSSAAYAQPRNTRSRVVSPRKIQARQQKAQKKYAKAQRKSERKMLKDSRKKSTYRPKRY
jgi:hypothetical protein